MSARPHYIVDEWGCLVIAAVIGILAAFLFPFWARAREEVRQASCMSSLKQIGFAFEMYSRDHGGRFPPPGNWNKPILDDYMHRFRDFCLSARDGKPTYAMNLSLKDMTVRQVEDTEHTMMVYESVTGWNLAGGPELLPSRPRHSGGNNFCFVDGHCKWHKYTRKSDLRWKL